MEAILLVGGKGTRLRPLTVTTPKPMLPVAGVPFTAHQLALARAAGVDRVVLATSYKAEVFSDWLGDGSRLGLDVEYVTESVPLGTGGAIRNVAGRLHSDPDDPVLVLNGDILSGHDITAQVAAHTAAGAAVTLHLTEVNDPRAFGCVPTDPTGRVTAFLEKTPDPVTNQINAGCYVFTRSVIDDIPVGRPVSVERDTFPGLLADGAHVLGHRDSAYWLDLGTPEAFVRGSRDLVLGLLPSPAVTGRSGDRLIQPGAWIHPDAVVECGSVIGAGALIGAGAHIHGSVIGDGAFIHPEATVYDSVVAAGAVIGARTALTGCVIGDHASVGADNQLPRGSRVWVEARIPDKSIRLTSDQS